MVKLFSPIGTVFGWLMYGINSVTNNYGITLILFTVLIKALMIPLGIKQQKSVIANARMQPKMAALQKMYGNNRERYGVELQKLYKEEKFSPYSSCLPTVVMLVLLFGVLDVIYYPLKHLLRMTTEQRSLAVTIATSVLGEGNLNRYSNEISVLNAVKLDPAPFIDGLGADITAKMQNFDFTMFGLPLGEQPTLTPGDKSIGLYIALLMIPLLSGLFSFLMGRLSMRNTARSDAPGANTMSNSMMIMMPLMSIWISFMVPAGVGLYWLISNIFSYVQQIVLNRVMNPAAEIEKARLAAEAEKEAERQARIEAKKRARELAAQGIEDPAVVSKKEADRRKIAEARRRMAEKYGDDYVEPKTSDVNRE